MKKATGIAAIVLASLAILVVGAWNVVLHTEARNAILSKIFDGRIDGSLRSGDIRVRLRDWPSIELTVDSLTLTYPHSAYASYRRPHDPGTGAEEDTLAVIARIRVRSDYRDLREGRITGNVEVNGLQGYVYVFDEGVSNLDIFHFGSGQEDTVSSGMPYIKAGLNIGKSRLAYIDRASSLSLFGSLSLDAEGIVSDDNTSVSAVVEADRFALRSGDFGVLLKNLSLEASADDSPEESIGRQKGFAGGGPRRMLPDFMSDESLRESDISVHLDESVSALMNRWHPRASVNLEEGYIVTSALPLRNKVHSARLTLDPDALVIDTLSLSSGSSDLEVTGVVRGLAHTLFGRGNGIWMADLDLSSDRLNVNEFLAAISPSDTSSSAAAVTSEALLDEEYLEETAVDSLEDVSTLTKPDLIVVPANVIARARLRAGLVDFDQFDIRDLSAQAGMSGRCIRVRDLSAVSNKGNVEHLNAYYSTRTREKIEAGFDIAVDSVSADRIRAIVPSLQKSIAPLRTFNGDFRCEAAATVSLDTNMCVILPTMEGTVCLHGEGLEVPELGDYKKYARLLMFRQLQNIALHNLDISGTISNNVVEVYPFLLEADRYSFALSGDQTLPTQFNYRATIIKSPLLIRMGGRVFGKNYSGTKFRLCKPQFKNTQVPVFYEEVDSLHRKVQDAVVNGTALNRRMLYSAMDVAKQHKQYSGEMEDLPEGSQSSVPGLTRVTGLPADTLRTKRQLSPLFR